MVHSIRFSSCYAYFDVLFNPIEILKANCQFPVAVDIYVQIYILFCILFKFFSIFFSTIVTNLYSQVFL